MPYNARLGGFIPRGRVQDPFADMADRARLAARDLASGANHLLYEVTGQRPIQATSRDPIVNLAQREVGTGSYDRLDPAPDARGGLRLGGRFDPKCNQFVYDMLARAGASPGRMADGRIPSASEWGDGRTPLKNFTPVTGPPREGDVISNGEHVGIAVRLGDGRMGTISAASPTPLGGHDGGVLGKVVQNRWGFRGDEGPMTVWRRSDGR
jgi:hypothetical protein